MPEPSAAAAPSSGSPSTTGSSAVFVMSVIVSNVCQVAWLAAADRVLSSRDFGSVLAAQALYSVLQIVIDSGTAFNGARLVASGELTAARRESLMGMRVLLAIPCVAVGLGVAIVSSNSMLAASSPYVIALVMFAALNVWEPYGRGRVGPYAAYLVLRSALLAGVAAIFLASGARLPIAAAGGVECTVIATVMLAFRLGRPGRHAASAFRSGQWRATFDIGLPAVLSQFNVAAAVVLLGVAGRNTAAAVVAVGARLLSGTVALSGAVAQGLFPRIARGKTWTPDDTRAAGIGLSLTLAVSGVSLGIGLLGAPLIVRAFLHRGIVHAQAAVVVVLAAAGAAGVTLHLSLVLVACRREDLMRSAAVWGAAAITVGACASVIVAAADAALVAALSLVAGQLVTTAMLAVYVGRSTSFVPAELRSVMTKLLVFAGLGLLGGLLETVRIPSGVVLLVLALGGSVGTVVQLRHSAAAALRAAARG